MENSVENINREKSAKLFTFTAPNGEEVTAVVLKTYNAKFVESYIGVRECVAYAQNKLFTCKLTFKRKYFYGCVPNGEDNPVVLDRVLNVEVFVEHAILPDYDELLAAK